MKFSFIALACLMLLACSSRNHNIKNLPANHASGRGIPAIDEIILELKGAFIEQCYKPIVNRAVPENSCQTELFQLLERRYRMDYQTYHVDMASDDLFFRTVDARVKRLVRSDPEVRDQVRAQFSSHEELMAYYKALYGFHPITSMN